MKNSWITFYFEQINKSNIYYVRISVYFRANWLHSFSQFLFVIGNSPFFNIEKFPKFLNPSRLITPYFLSFFLSFFLFKNFSQIFKIFLRRRKFREICSHPIRGCSLILSREWHEKSSDGIESIDQLLADGTTDSFLRRISYDTAFLRNIPERYSILPTCLLNLFAVIS